MHVKTAKEILKYFPAFFSIIMHLMFALYNVIVYTSSV